MPLLQLLAKYPISILIYRGFLHVVQAVFVNSGVAEVTYVGQAIKVFNAVQILKMLFVYIEQSSVSSLIWFFLKYTKN